MITDRLIALISVLCSCMLLYIDFYIGTNAQKLSVTKCDSNNYHASIDCLENCLTQLKHASLSTDNLQVGFKALTSTMACTTLMIETIDNDCLTIIQLIVVCYYLARL